MKTAKMHAVCFWQNKGEEKRLRRGLVGIPMAGLRFSQPVAFIFGFDQAYDVLVMPHKLPSLI